MTKEEILEKSRKAGQGFSDERELQIQQKAKAMAQTISLVFCMLLSATCVILDGPEIISSTAWAISCLMYAVDHAVQAVYLKKAYFWVFTILWLIAFFAFLRVLGNAFV